MKMYNPPHPGEVLRELCLKPLSLTVTKAARALGVSPSRVSRWLNGEQPDPENRRKLEGLEFVLARLSMMYTPRVAWDWLHGMNPFLHDNRPIDVLSRGRVTDVLEAIDADEAGSYA